ncbi:hypothetical protein SCATT_21480 [Streptantibioticus cattleyicolor NRRL 8057 = DSM 46488]|uniref:Histidine kinase/HSP90-like ATPase domain-containing protein n=1 Tax=Streptantibioticus cattleyicolor (strain ATCC 35852 / DSM 46488 / JCM 4925 / NBRC 14057 / NRRL 8057) TaxID=1003195 RepID=G8X284_STREN|nr:hypothetical protein SCATT_21480 [Streptantibioticus cattleyicolor NRRL 8057 = DSM 46488]
MSSAWLRRQFIDDRPGVCLVTNDVRNVSNRDVDRLGSDPVPTGRITCRRWPRHPRSVARARAELGEVLADWGLEDIAEAAILVLSELLTNSVRHAHVAAGRQIKPAFCERARASGSRSTTRP